MLTCGSAGSNPLGSGATVRPPVIKLDLRRCLGNGLHRADSILRVPDFHADVQAFNLHAPHLNHARLAGDAEIR